MSDSGRPVTFPERWSRTVSRVREAQPGRQVPMTTQVTARHSILVLPLAAALVALTVLLAAGLRLP